MNREVRVMCDECGDVHPEWFVNKSHDEMTQLLQEAGWTRTNRDLCPACSAGDHSLV